MKSFANKAFLVLAVVLCASCHGDQQEGCDFAYQANVDEIKDTVQFQDIVESYRLIPLESADGCRIGQVSDLIVKDSLMYVVSDGVYCFDKTGSQMFCINRKGHAQNEYTRISSVNVSGGNIYLYDVMQGKVLVFDRFDGTFRRKIDNPHTVARIFCNGESCVADRSDLASTVVPGDERFFVYETNHPENVSQAFLAEAENKLPMQGQTILHEDGFFFTNFWRCQTWKLTVGECLPYFQLIFSPDYAIDKAELESLIASKQPSSESLEKAEKAWGMLNVHENDCNITGDFRVGKSLASFIFDKEGKTCIAYKYVKAEGPWQPNPKCFKSASQDKMYNVMPAEDIVMLRSILGLPTLPKQDVGDSNPYNIYCSVSESDNPIVIEYKLK